jgi:hypothetical protein
MVSCTKDRELPGDQAPILQPPGDDIRPGYLLINEFLAVGDGYLNEFGVPSDWIEVYNPNFFDVLLNGENWYITDEAAADETKFKLPQIIIPARGFILIWADNSFNEPGANDIHTNFALSGSGEHLGLFYQFDSELIKIDDFLFLDQTENISEGRVTDGAAIWTKFESPTPGMPNL